MKTEIGFVYSDYGLCTYVFVINLPTYSIILYNCNYLRHRYNLKKGVYKWFIRQYKKNGCNVCPMGVKNRSVNYNKYIYLLFSDIEEMIGGDNTEEIKMLKDIKNKYGN